jgi:hypothetical protein
LNKTSLPDQVRLAPRESNDANSQILYYVRALALGIPAILLGLQISGWIFFIPVIRNGHFDFRHLYTAGYMVRTGHAHELYDYQREKQFEDTLVSREEIALPFNHPAYEALLFVPLSFFTFKQAYFMFLAFNLAFLAAAYQILRPYIDNLQLAWRWLGPAMFMTFLPNVAALMQGQDSILLMALFSGSFVMLLKKREFLGGLLLGLALFKFQVVLPVAVLFAIWRCWSVIAGLSLSGAAVAALSVALVGISQVNTYAHSLFAMGIGLSSKAEQFRYGISPSSMPNLRGLAFGLLQDRLPGGWIQIAIVGISGVLLLFAARSGVDKSNSDRLLLAIVTSVLVSYHLLIHDMGVLLVPITVLISKHLFSEATGGPGRDQLRAAALLFVSPIWMSFAPNLFFVISAASLVLFLVLTLKVWEAAS